jgi:hypothetical protein
MPKPLKTNFQALIENDVAPAVTASAEPTTEIVSFPARPAAPLEAPSAPAKRKGTLKQRARQQTLYLEIPLHDTLREIAFAERTSLHALYLEGIDAVLKKRGQPSIKELLRGKARPVL